MFRRNLFASSSSSSSVATALPSFSTLLVSASCLCSSSTSSTTMDSEATAQVMTRVAEAMAQRQIILHDSSSSSSIADDSKALLSPDEIRELVATVDFSFKPHMVGALTLREAISRFPQLFTVTSTSSGNDSSSLASWRAQATDNIVASIRRKNVEQKQAKRLEDLRSKEQQKTALQASEDEPHAEESISTAAAIARALRNYRAANPLASSDASSDNNDNRKWIDLEKLMSSKFARTNSSSSSSLKSQTNGSRSSSSSPPALRPLQTAEDIVAGSTVFRAAGLELRPQLLVRLARPPRAAHVFVDADQLSADDIHPLITNLRLVEQHSTVVVARKATSSSSMNHHQQSTNSLATTQTSTFSKIISAATHLYSKSCVQDDVIVPHNVPTYMVVEKLAAKLSLARTVVLNDVVFICSNAQFSMYCKYISKATPFLDADVFVVCAARSEQVYSKVPRPSVSPTLTTIPGYV